MTFKIRREEENQQSPSTSNIPLSDSPSSAAHPYDEHWERATIHRLLYTAYRDQRSDRVWRNIWRGVSAALFAATLLTLYSCGQSGSGSNRQLSIGSKPHTAVVNLTGTIGGGQRDQVTMLRDGLKAAYDNPRVKGIIIRANSPGGSPVVSNTAFLEIRRMKAEKPNIPLYVVAEDVCASGCYYIAAAADKIYADPSSLVGSIGVIGGGFDFTGLMDKLGVKRRLRIAGDNKGMGDPFTPETPQQQAIWQQMLNDIHSEFIKAVKTGRGQRLQDRTYPDIFSGRIYSGLEAKKVGLIDDFGNIYSVARDVIKAPELVDYTSEEDDLARALSRRLNGEVQNQVKQSLEQLDTQGW